MRQLLTESLLLAVAGGALGIGLAWVSLDLLIEFVGRFTARTGQINIDTTVLAYSTAAALLSGLMFGTAPALAARRTLISAMRTGGAQSGDTPSRQRLRGVLVAAQVAVSCVLLVGAGLLIESTWRLAAEPLGFNGDRVLTAAFFGNFSRQQSLTDAVSFNDRVLERLRATHLWVFHPVRMLEQVLRAYRPQELQREGLPLLGIKTPASFCNTGQLQLDRLDPLETDGEYLVQMGGKVIALQLIECLHLFPKLGAATS